MHAVKIKTLVCHLIIDFLGNMFADGSLLPGNPEAENILDKFDQQTVALDVGLLAEKIDQAVVAAGQLIHTGRQVPEFSFGADFAEVNGKQPQKLLDQTVGRSNVRVEQTGNVALNQVRIPDENAADFQMNNQRGNEPFRPARLQGDDFQPGADRPDVFGIDPHLPFGRRSLNLRIFKSVGDQFVHERFHQGVVVLCKNLPGRRENAVDARAAEFTPRCVFFQETENFPYKNIQVLFLFLLKNKFQRRIDFPHGADVEVLQTRRRHDAEEEIQLHKVTARIGFGFFQRGGDPEVGVEDLEIIRKRQKVPEMRPGFFAVPGTKRFELQHQLAEPVMRKRPDQFQIRGFVRRRLGLAFGHQP